MKYFVLIFTVFLTSVSLGAQDTLILRRDSIDHVSMDQPESVEPIFTKLSLKGRVYSAMISDGDTLIY